MGTQLPDLDYRTIYTLQGGVLTPGQRVRTALMNFVMPGSTVSVHYTSNDAKVDPASGKPYNHYGRKLPEIPIAAMLIATYQNQRAKGTNKAQDFPYKLKATGLVNPYEIIQFQNEHNHYITNDVRVVP